MRPLLLLLALVPGLAAAQAPTLGVLKFQDETGAMPFQGGAGRVLTNTGSQPVPVRV